MKFTSIIEDELKELLKKVGEVPVKCKDKVIGKAYIDDKNNHIIEIFENEENTI